MYRVGFSLPYAKPVYIMSYGVCMEVKEANRDEKDKILETKVFECKQTECGSAVLFVSKENATIRFCVVKQVFTTARK